MVPTDFYKEREHMTKELKVPSSDLLLLLQHDLCSSSKDHNFSLEKSFQVSPKGSKKEVDPISHLLMVVDLFKVD